MQAAPQDPRRAGRARSARRVPRGARPLWIALALTCGCQAERAFEIVSEPPGAEVRIDETSVGVTPLRIPFKHYGTRRFTFYKVGYLTKSRVVPTRPPWYAHFPLDLASELLFGWAWSDVHPIEVSLETEVERPTKEAVEALLLRAEALRLGGPSGPRGASSAGQAPPDGSTPR